MKLTSIAIAAASLAFTTVGAHASLHGAVDPTADTSFAARIHTLPQVGVVIDGPMDAATPGDKAGSTQSVMLQVTSPVPEPESWALMLAGLVGMGVVARRRSKL